MTIAFNPMDADQVDAQLPALARLRHEAPITEPFPRFFYVARHADIVSVCRAPTVFQQGRFLPLEEDDRSDDELNLGETNPPSHTRVRKILAGLLSPPRVRPLEPAVRGVCDELVGQFAERGTADLVAELGAPLPGAVIGPLTGLAPECYGQFRGYSDDLLGLASGDPDIAQTAQARLDAFDAMARRAIAERRAMSDRPDDLLTGLVESVDEEGNHLSDGKILVHLTKDTIVGGTETTTHLIGNLFYNLLRTPGAYARVRDDRSLVPAAVEETLRISGPVQVLFRCPVTDARIDDVDIPADSIVALGYASANRDEAVFPDPDSFSLDRGDELRHQHFGFGYGIHYCVGAPLARLEATCALDAVLDRIPEMRLADGFEYERVRFWMMRGPVRVDVVFSGGSRIS
jgi:cytochrome P450